MRVSVHLTAAFVLVLAPALLWGAGNQDKPPAPATGYVGSEVCAGCHEDKVPKALAFHKILETDKRYKRVGQTCESCHGPGQAHAESADITKIVSFKNATPARVSQACLTCHAEALRMSARANDPHSRNSLSCVTCHVIHKPSAEPLLVKAKAELCITCHTDVKAEFARPYRHKVQEGMVGCTDCHNPHGTVRNTALRAHSGNEAGCVGCHGDKRGPFVFEHAPVNLEGCAACHEPHGSVNPRMLKRAEVKSLCLECHTLTPATLGGPPPAFHDLRNPRFQNCTTCHIKVHGSNVNREFLK